MARWFGSVWLALLVASTPAAIAAEHAAEQSQPLRIGLTPVILEDQLSFLDEWQTYLERRTGREVQFVRRNSYGEVVELALRGRIDFAWLCGYPYVQHDTRLGLLAVPRFNGAPSTRPI